MSATMAWLVVDIPSAIQPMRLHVLTVWCGWRLVSAPVVVASWPAEREQ